MTTGAHRAPLQKSPRERDADHIARHDHLDAAIELPASCGLVRRRRHCLTEAARTYRINGNALLHEEVSYGRSALFRKQLVELIASDIVRVTLDLQPQPRMREHNAGNLS